MIADAASGQTLLRAPAPGELPFFYNLALRSADGNPMQFGGYDNAVLAPVAGAQPGLSLLVYCLNPAGVRGRFQLLQLVRGSDGSIQRPDSTGALPRLQGRPAGKYFCRMLAIATCAALPCEASYNGSQTKYQPS